jgi:hypothetical protein
LVKISLIAFPKKPLDGFFDLDPCYSNAATILSYIP